jgi:hypothetical protein
VKTEATPTAVRREPIDTPPGPPRGGETTSDQADGATGKTDSTVDPAGEREGAIEHEGATENEVGDRTGPGVGYDQEPEQTPDTGGVA